MRTKTSQVAEKILTVAARWFATYRFHEARMEDIAAVAEVGKGTLYRYFKDKDELYTALLERAAEQLGTRLRQEMAKAEGAQDKLEAIAGSLIGYFDEQPHLFDLIMHAEALHRADTVFRWQQTREETIRLVCGEFEAAKENGEFAIDDPAFAALMLLGGIRAVIRFGEQPRPANQVRQLVHQFLHGFARAVVKPQGRSMPSSV